MKPDPASPTLDRARPAASGQPVTPMLLADAILRAAALGIGVVTVEPEELGHTVYLDDGRRGVPVGHLDREMGNAVVARLATVAGLDLGGAPEQLGRARVQVGAREAVLYVALRESEGALSGEVVRVTDAAGQRAEKRFGIYRIVRELGRGGMGVVYLAEHEVLRKPVAIKLVNEELVHDRELVARFVLEARAASRVRHPNIVDVTDFGTLDDGRPFLVMEFVDGATLQTRLDDGPVPVGQAVAWVRQIALALHAVHAKGIVHRDLKPANVFVDSEGMIKVCDFGAAKIMNSGEAGLDGTTGIREAVATRAGMIIGTPEYMAPEHARGLDIDHRIDVYALGCILYALVKGAPPFDASTAIDLLMAHILQPIPKLTSVHGPVPEALQAIIEKALAKEANDRYATAADLAADLEPLVAELGRGRGRKGGAA